MNAKHISMVLAAVAVTVGMTSCDKVVDSAMHYLTNLFVPKYDAAKPEESVKAMMEDMDSDQKKQLVAAICISEVIDISPSLSSLCFFQPSVSHQVLCIEVK